MSRQVSLQRRLAVSVSSICECKNDLTRHPRYGDAVSKNILNLKVLNMTFVF